MFEYLMPMLVMRSFPYTVLAQTYDGRAARGRSPTARERGVPWGVSESAYNVRDRHHTYQYRPFGVPDLALKRGLGRELVVAPYASVLARDDRSRSARWPTSRGSRRRARSGRYGFRDALDYTRPDPGRDATPWSAPTWRTTSGMSLVALTNVLDRDSLAARASTPTRWCARPSCCCTSGSRAGWCCRSRRAPGADEALPEAGDRAPVGARARHARHARSRTSRCSATCPTPSW